MTLKGKQNNYNVKLLRGYGVSINLKDHQVILKDGQNDITGESTREELKVILIKKWLNLSINMKKSNYGYEM